MSNLESFAFRSFEPENDLVRLLKLRSEVEHHDQEGIHVTLEALKAALQVPGHDPIRDRCLAVKKENPNLLVGYSSLWASGDDADLQVIVHPAYRRLGLGTELLRRSLLRAGEYSARKVNAYASGKHTAANAFLLASGFIRQGNYTEMRSEFLADLPPAKFSPGYSVRSYAEVKDLTMLTNAFTECYKGLSGHHIALETQVAEWLPSFDESALWLLFDPEGKCVGLSRTEMNKERSEQAGKPTGYIDAPGLQLPLRSEALYHALLLHGMHALRERGAALIDLESWGDDPALLTSYEQFGFKVIRSQISYKRGL